MYKPNICTWQLSSLLIAHHAVSEHVNFRVEISTRSSFRITHRQVALKLVLAGTTSVIKASHQITAFVSIGAHFPY